MRHLKSISILMVTAAAATMPGAASAQSAGHASGRGLLTGTDANGDDARRQFSFSAAGKSGGIATGSAMLRNPAFDGTDGKPYFLKIDVKCLKVVGNIAVVGGTTQRTNDENLVDAVFFTAQDNGEPGAGQDKISRAFFWDDDPNTTGDPMACLNTGANDFPLEEIEQGNITVKGGTADALQFRTP